MMPLDRMPSVSLGVIVPAGATYDTHHHWRTDTGALRASVRFELSGYSYATIQGDPVARRELAGALVEAAGQAQGWHAPAAALDGLARDAEKNDGHRPRARRGHDGPRRGSGKRAAGS